MSSSKLNSSWFSDRSMLEALGGPGERSILSQKRRTGNGDGEEEKDESLGGEESQQDGDIAEEVEVKRESDERPGSHVSESVDEWRDAEKREEEEEEEKRANSEEDSVENMTKEKKGKSALYFFMSLVCMNQSDDQKHVHSAPELHILISFRKKRAAEQIKIWNKANQRQRAES